METKTRRPDVRMEPQLYLRLKEHCARKQISIARFVRDLIIQELRSAGSLSPDDLKIMRGLS